MNTVAEIFPPGEFLREELEARGWSQTELAEIIGRPVRLINELIAGKKAPDNPWGEGATTLEWTLSSPPPFHQFETLPVIDDDKRH